jgi:signal peptidase I
MLATRFFFRSFRSAAPVARPTAELQCIPDEGLLAGQLQKSASAKPPGILREFLQAALLTLLVFFLIRLVAGNFRVSGDSMEPTLLEGQILGVNRLAYAHLDGTLGEGRVPNTRQGSVEYIFGGPQRGDIVVFRKRIGRNLALVKRVIGLPGDRILIGDGRVFVNGQPVDEPYVRFPQTDKTYPEDGEPVEVPDGSYFVLGDNRPESSDSREDWFVPVENLVGRVWLSYWPPATWGTVR